jgi:hypothetical protein
VVVTTIVRKNGHRQTLFIQRYILLITSWGYASSVIDVVFNPFSFFEGSRIFSGCSVWPSCATQNSREGSQSCKTQISAKNSGFGSPHAHQHVLTHYTSCHLPPRSELSIIQGGKSLDMQRKRHCGKLCHQYKKDIVSSSLVLPIPFLQLTIPSIHLTVDSSHRC